jgi:1-deoxy-D-xylulose-5-phosphate reductoisomerase
MKKRIAILGSTGSIGTQALDVVREHPAEFTVEVLTGGDNADLLIKQAVEFQPNMVVVGNESLYSKVSEALAGYDIKVYAGAKAIEDVVETGTVDLVLMAIMGFAALRPTFKAIDAGKNLAIANKETFVVAGEIMVEKAGRSKTGIIPVDSEHSAIFQCLAGEYGNPVEKIYLTASGGPFRGKSVDFLKTVKASQALKHPNWDMGAKITIDSATMMNKGFEMIEAKWLFGLQPHQIDVLVHPQSIVHSMVQFEDGSLKAQMGLPDMKLPIQYAMAYPQRLKNNFERMDFAGFSNLTFEQPDRKVFRSLVLAEEAMKRGGNSPCIVNAANEVAVAAFLKDKIGFMQIPELIEYALQNIEYIKNPSEDDYFSTDEKTRIKVSEQIN